MAFPTIRVRYSQLLEIMTLILRMCSQWLKMTRISRRGHPPGSSSSMTRRTKSLSRTINTSQSNSIIRRASYQWIQIFVTLRTGAQLLRLMTLPASCNGWLTSSKKLRQWTVLPLFWDIYRTLRSAFSNLVTDSEPFWIDSHTSSASVCFRTCIGMNYKLCVTLLPKRLLVSIS